MAFTEIQRRVCRLIAANRVASGESYVAGGVALNELLRAPRVSQDIDLFHDTEEALAATWSADRALLAAHGYRVTVVRERPSFVEAELSDEAGRTLAQWVRDSAFRFFPLVEHPDFGLVLHPFDLATNKVLALVGRLEPRDWIDLIACVRSLQPLGYLAWAACGKDPGYSPGAILEHAARTSRYTASDLAGLAFDGGPPDPANLSREWRGMLSAAREILPLLPPDEVGKCVLDAQGRLFTGGSDTLSDDLVRGRVRFHAGRIRGAYPEVRPA